MLSATARVDAATSSIEEIDEKTWVQLHDWADSKTKEWSKQIKAVMTRQQRCESMARLRVLKKSEFQQLQAERKLLESQVKKCLATMNQEGDNSSELYRALHRLALECDALRTENVEMMKEIHSQERFQFLIQARAIGVIPEANDTSSPNVYTASKSSPWVPSSQHEDGWRVPFPNGSTSTRSLKLMYHAPLTRRASDDSLVGHVRLSARVSCSFDQADAAVSPSELNWWPLVFTPPNWSHSQRSSVSIQVLQSFAIDAHVLVCNIPGPVHTRYFQFANRQLKVEANGKRSFTCSLVLADSKENMRIRAAEEPQPGVEWIDEGGARIKFLEVDDNIIDVNCHLG
ncbi:uncharacterized protein PITG_15744 [Phytophthora infestans T30-4]|uniref:Uncharacterized protein n=1 Tax=Phytophthora infestans (strain T30-4) TaxID=403677 RepID=D0NSG2_PHYIT|nr:uncharacterized protein PITG_15744 [Phytophthora infestans T30-4]EEY64507.1 conserved hypothetical protein [Phytophthora infestans T30-4]|eukprot:XP_002898010.1 conserved hypothetical protein [Phytophthora infestans T30-4]